MSHTVPLRRAIQLACEQVPAGGGPFGAVIVRGGVVVAEGANRVTLDNDPTAHAEVVAIRAACRTLNSFELRGCTLYSSCEPCPMCLSAIHWARIDRVIYAADRNDAAQAGFDDALLYRVFTHPADPRPVPVERLLPQEGTAPFTVWDRFTGRTAY